jgi:monoterpene epsilon-lactone hydrolase
MTVIPIDENDIAPARALRTEFARFWSTAQGERRDVYDEFIRATPAARGVATRGVTDDPGPGRWSEPADSRPGRAILFLHGGSYTLGHTDAYVGLVSQIAIRARVAVFALEYPLAPEATIPVARDLAVRTIERLTTRFSSVAVVGDSAGGGL